MADVRLVIARGLRDVADGRKFVVETWDDGQPDVSSPDTITITRNNEEVKVIGVVHPEIDLVCRTCGELKKRHLICHTYNWMYTAFTCPNHPHEALLDFFPKRAPDTRHDWTNAFLADLDSVSNKPLPKGVTIEGYQGPGERFAWYEESTKGTIPYYLTPHGVIRPRDPIFYVDHGGWFNGLIEWCRSFKSGQRATP